MHNIFRSTLLLSVLIGCFSAHPVVAGGDDIIVQDSGSFVQVLQEATGKNDTALINSLINKHKQFVKPETLAKPLTLAIQNNNPELSLLFLKAGRFNIREIIPGTVDTPLEMALRTRKTDVTYAILFEKTFRYTDNELTQAMQLMYEVENASRPHAEEPVSTTPSIVDADSHWAAWGIGIAAVGTIAAFIARRLLLQQK